MGPTAFARLTAVSGVQADVCHSTPLVDGGPETIVSGTGKAAGSVVNLVDPCRQFAWATCRSRAGGLFGISTEALPTSYGNAGSYA